MGTKTLKENALIKRAIIPLILGLFLSGCGLTIGLFRESMPPVCVEYESGAKAINQFSFEEQYAILECWMLRTQPPDLGVAKDMATNGEKIVPFLTEKLKREKSEWMQEAVFRVFEEMSGKYYDVKNDQELMKTLTESYFSIKNSKAKHLIYDHVQVILEAKEISKGSPDERRRPGRGSERDN
ncbi:MAG: hypothetical protein HY889_00905 [Deltaproteobacteria bacterium]|nr:hypothetical protein [Deltaproteobacteria bacterium]